jgi:hypothetical protein
MAISTKQGQFCLRRTQYFTHHQNGKRLAAYGDFPLIDHTVRNRFERPLLPAYFGFATTASDLKLRSRICAGSANSSFLKICCDLPLVASANATSRRPVAMMVYLPEPGYVAYSRRNRIFHNCLAKPNLTHIA